jgi:hypothetical protein
MRSVTELIVVVVVVVVDTAGTCRCVYGEDLDFSSLGPVRLRRASHVEPDAAGRWSADLSPVRGPVLGPFRLRGEALAAEERWLVEHWLEASAAAAADAVNGSEVP